MCGGFLESAFNAWRSFPIIHLEPQVRADRIYSDCIHNHYHIISKVLFCIIICSTERKTKEIGINLNNPIGASFKFYIIFHPARVWIPIGEFSKWEKKSNKIQITISYVRIFSVFHALKAGRNHIQRAATPAPTSPWITKVIWLEPVYMKLDLNENKWRNINNRDHDSRAFWWAHKKAKKGRK